MTEAVLHSPLLSWLCITGEGPPGCWEPQGARGELSEQSPAPSPRTPAPGRMEQPQTKGTSPTHSLWTGHTKHELKPPISQLVHAAAGQIASAVPGWVGISLSAQKTLFKSPFQSPNPKTTACSATHLSAWQPPRAPCDHEHKAVIVSGQGWGLQRRSPKTRTPSPCESVPGVIAQRGTAIPQPRVCLLQPLEEKPKKSRKIHPGQHCRAISAAMQLGEGLRAAAPQGVPAPAPSSCSEPHLLPNAPTWGAGRIWGISAFLAKRSGCSPSSAQFAKPQKPHKTSRKQATDLHEVFLNPKARGHTRAV